MVVWTWVGVVVVGVGEVGINMGDEDGGHCHRDGRTLYDIKGVR